MVTTHNSCNNNYLHSLASSSCFLRNDLPHIAIVSRSPTIANTSSRSPEHSLGSVHGYNRALITICGGYYSYGCNAGFLLVANHVPN